MIEAPGVAPAVNVAEGTRRPRRFVSDESIYQAVHVRGDQFVDLPSTVAFMKRVRKGNAL
jgi:hypothetical protein